MAFVQANVNYAQQYARELANAYPYLSYFGDKYIIILQAIPKS